MRGQFTLILILTMVFAGTYLYREASSMCPVPITYRIGEIGEGFTITEEEAKGAVAIAAASWEGAAEQDLFIYDPDSDFTINFVFDERQEYADAEEDFREKLNVTEGVNDLIDETYTELTTRYSTLEEEYQAKVDSYESHLASYNKRVKEQNDSGGAPRDVYQALQEEQQQLDEEMEELNALGNRLNTLAGEINKVGERGNQLVDVYNRNVAEYNEVFGESHEFTQGDFRGDRINVYKFSDTAELELVLAHELGHALSLDHVANNASLMYHLMGGQPSDIHLSREDLVEFNRVCKASFFEKIRMVLKL